MASRRRTGRDAEAGPPGPTGGSGSVAPADPHTELNDEKSPMFTIAAFVDALTLEEVGTDRYRANSLQLARTASSSAASCWRSP